VPKSGKAGNKASIDSATIDIKEAIKATNSNLKVCVFCMMQKYFIITELILIGLKNISNYAL
jgi:hypothetical protein